VAPPPSRKASPRQRELDHCEQELDAAVRAFQGFDDVAATRERLRELREQRDQARDRLAKLEAATAPAVAVSASGEWESLSLEEQRALIQAVVARAVVAPGRGPERITVEAFGE
jgi:hypothetical protein